MLLVDSSMVFHRCFHAMEDLTTVMGVPTGMEYGTLRILESLTKKYPGHRLILCFDSKKNWRKKRDSRYKANRNPEEKRYDVSAFIKRANALKEALKQLYWFSECEGQEADDLLYRIAKLNATGAEPHGTYIYTNDHDLLQSVFTSGHEYEQIIVLKSHNSSIYEWDEEKVSDKFGVLPWQLPLYRAMIGDKSDNLEGVGRVDKDLIRECVRTAFRHTDLHSDVAVYENFVQALIHYREINRWTDKEWLKVYDMIHGNLLDNYQLMKLGHGPAPIRKPSGDLDLVRAFLEDKEIRSLDICKGLVSEEAIENEEF